MDSIHHFTNEKGSEAEMCSILGSGIVTGVAPVNLIPRPSNLLTYLQCMDYDMMSSLL